MRKEGLENSTFTGHIEGKGIRKAAKNRLDMFEQMDDGTNTTNAMKVSLSGKYF